MLMWNWISRASPNLAAHTLSMCRLRSLRILSFQRCVPRGDWQSWIPPMACRPMWGKKGEGEGEREGERGRVRERERGDSAKNPSESQTKTEMLLTWNILPNRSSSPESWNRKRNNFKKQLGLGKVGKLLKLILHSPAALFGWLTL